MIKNRFFLLLICFVLFLFIFPDNSVRKLRNFAISVFSPSKKGKEVSSDALERLQTENQLLEAQIERLKEWVLEEKRVESQWERLLEIAEKSEDPFFERRRRYLVEIINRHLHGLPGHVIFREPSPWSNSIWVNVGERDNRALGIEIIAKNSPVVVGKTVVGVVEEVLEKKSRVLLITDRTLTPCVRAVRGLEQNRLLFDKLTTVIKLLAKREDLYGAREAAGALTAFQEQLDLEDKELYLAKGEIHGSNSPLWRVPGKILKGVGFNYDFPDEEGPSRELRTGAYEEGQHPLLKVGDLLVTTGMDGIFPADLYVGVVTKIFPLHEGGTSYEIEAESLVENLNTLTEVVILPPLG